MTILGPFSYEGGMNTKCGPYDTPKNSYVDGQNVELVYGRLSKKKGNLRWTSPSLNTTSPMRGLTYFQGQLVGEAGGKVKTASATVAGAWTDITGSIVFASNYNTWMAALNNILIIGGQSASNNVKWTGSGNAAHLGASSPVGGVAGVSVNNYLFIGGTDANPSRLQWSAIQDPTSWPVGNFADILIDDVSTAGLGIQALWPFGEDVLIFKTNAITRFYTNQLSGTLGPNIVVTDKYGCAGPQCVDTLPDGRVAFIGYNNHVYIYDGNSFEDISDQPPPMSNIQSTLNALTFKTAGFRQGFLKVYQAKNQIWISYPFSWVSPLGTTYQSLILIYDIINKCWICSYPDHMVLKAVNYFNGSEYFMTAGYDGNVYQEDTGDENNDTNKQSTAFDGYVTKSFVFGADSEAFIPRSVYFGLSTGKLNGKVYYGANGYNNPTLSAVISISATAQERKLVVPVTSRSGRWNTGQFRFDGNASNQPFLIAPMFISDEIEAQV